MANFLTSPWWPSGRRKWPSAGWLASRAPQNTLDHHKRNPVTCIVAGFCSCRRARVTEAGGLSPSRETPGDLVVLLWRGGDRNELRSEISELAGPQG